eukprot:240115-Heterocapsa_arctica.AAC.1
MAMRRSAAAARQKPPTDAVAPKGRAVPTKYTGFSETGSYTTMTFAKRPQPGPTFGRAAA